MNSMVIFHSFLYSLPEGKWNITRKPSRTSNRFNVWWQQITLLTAGTKDWPCKHMNLLMEWSFFHRSKAACSQWISMPVAGMLRTFTFVWPWKFSSGFDGRQVIQLEPRHVNWQRYLLSCWILEYRIFGQRQVYAVRKNERTRIRWISSGTNSSPWKDPPMFKFGINHLFRLGPWLNHGEL